MNFITYRCLKLGIYFLGGLHPAMRSVGYVGCILYLEAGDISNLMCFFKGQCMGCISRILIVRCSSCLETAVIFWSLLPYNDPTFGFFVEVTRRCGTADPIHQCWTRKFSSYPGLDSAWILNTKRNAVVFRGKVKWN